MTMTTDQLRHAVRAEEAHAPSAQAVLKTLQQRRPDQLSRLPRGTTARKPMIKHTRRYWPHLISAAAVIAVLVCVPLFIAQSRQDQTPVSAIDLSSRPMLDTFPAVATPSDRTTEANGIRPVLDEGPLTMIPGTPGINAENQAQQFQYEAGGTGPLKLEGGCMYIADNLVAVFDSNSTDWDGTALTYWGIRFTIGQSLHIGGEGGLTIADVKEGYPGAYVPAGCPSDASAFLINTVEPAER